MTLKLLDLAIKLKSLGLSALQKAPLPIGIALGYIFHAEIGLAFKGLKALLKMLLNLL